jgi:hypothetical protein
VYCCFFLHLSKSLTNISRNTSFVLHVECKALWHSCSQELLPVSLEICACVWGQQLAFCQLHLILTSFYNLCYKHFTQLHEWKTWLINRVNTNIQARCLPVDIVYIWPEVYNMEEGELSKFFAGECLWIKFSFLPAPLQKENLHIYTLPILTNFYNLGYKHLTQLHEWKTW